MSEEAVAEAIEPETPTETGDADVSTETEAPETPTEKSDADSEPALDADKPVEAADGQKELAEKSYKRRESRRVQKLTDQNTKLMSMLEQAVQPEKAESKAPKVEDFESLDDYVSASVQHALNAGKPEQAVSSPNEAVFNQKCDDLAFEGAGKYEDFVDKVRSSSQSISGFMLDVITEIEDIDNQVEVAYSLANNPREAARISRLSPMRQAAEIGKLEAKLSTPKPAIKQPSTAPKPIKPVSGSKTPNSAHQPSDDMKTFMDKRNKELGR